MFGALKRGRFRSLASLILVVNVVGGLQQKRTLAASRGFLAAARLSCFYLQTFCICVFCHCNSNSIAYCHLSMMVIKKLLTFLPWGLHVIILMEV